MKPPPTKPSRAGGWLGLTGLWLVVAALVIASNLMGKSGALGLDRDVLRYDGAQVTVEVRDLGPLRSSTEGEGSAVYHRSAGVFATAAEKRIFHALFIGQLLVIVAGVLCVERLVRGASRRQPFARAHVIWLRLLAVVVATGGIVLPALMHRWEDSIIAAFSRDMEIRHQLESLSTGPGQAAVAVVAILLVLAEVWKRGIVLQDDVEATV